MTCPCGIEDWKCAQGNSCQESQSIHELTTSDLVFFWGAMILPTVFTVVILATVAIL